METIHPTINLDGKDRKMAFTIEEVGNVEARHGDRHIGDLMNGGRIPMGIMVTMLWQSLQIFSPEDFVGEHGRKIVAQLITDWMKLGDQTNKWKELSKKLTDAMMNAGLVQEDPKKKELPAGKPNPSAH